jgi:hypothetical protein
MKKKLIFPLLIITVIVIVSVIVFNKVNAPVLENKNNEIPADIKNDAIPSDWLTYKNDKGGYEFKYPSGVGYSTPEAAGVWQGSLTDKYPSYNIELSLSQKDQPPEIWFFRIASIENRDFVQQDILKNLNSLVTSEITINGTRYTRYSARPGLDYKTEYYLPTTEKFFAVVIDGKNPVAQQIFSSFKTFK